MFDQNRRDSSHPPQTPLTPHTPFTPSPANQASEEIMDIDQHQHQHQLDPPLPTATATATTTANPFPTSHDHDHHRLSTRSFFESRLHRLRTPLHALVSVTTGLPHPRFPPSMLHFYLLTEAELDELAHFYHQRTPSHVSLSYPAPVVGRWVREGGRVDEKRRRFGRFVGLRGCESPGVVGGGRSGEEDGDGDGEERMRREMEVWVQERIRRGLERETEREIWRGKGFGR